MEIIAGTAATLPPGVLPALARYRHQVFVEKLGWDLDSRDGMEYDQFDRPDTLYVVARRRSGELIGTARLLSTDRPYLLSEVFPQLLGDVAAPQTPLVWELSRFAAVDFGSSPTAVAHQFASPLALDLLRKALSLASEAGVERLISVSPLGIERILRNAGFAARRAAAPVVVDGRPLFACWIEVRDASSD